MTEGWDWTRVQHERCPQCGFDPATYSVAEVGPALVEASTGWSALLAGTDAARLAQRPAPEVWGALELGAHVRDVLRVFRDRIALTLGEEDPELGWWDHEAAAVEEGYAAQDPLEVGRAIEDAAQALAADLAAVAPDAAWDRTATRRGTEPFTVAGMARFTLHEVVHHLADARSALAPPIDGAAPTRRP